MQNDIIFKELVHKSFEQRRKKISNSLSSTKFMNMSKEEISGLLVNCGLGENARAEELPIEKYIEISNFSSNTKNI
ncbi:16S ribosomal RNA methyltransferase KsgA/Dim1 family protein [compost metagenome]